jgi:hypothetical protein
MAESRQKREQEGPAPVPGSSSSVDESAGQRDRLSGDELERSVSDQELGPHQHKATPPAGTYEEPRPQTDPGYEDAGQRLANRANDEQDERERERERSSSS